MKEVKLFAILSSGKLQSILIFTNQLILTICTATWVYMTYSITTQVRKKKKSPPSEFKQSRMLLNFIDSSLQASAKQQAQITLVWKKTKNPQPFSGSVCNGLIKKPKSCWCGRLCWSRAVLCNSFVHLRTPSNLKWVLSYSTWDLLTVDHSNKWVGAGWQKLLAGVSLPLFFPFATRWSQ